MLCEFSNSFAGRGERAGPTGVGEVVLFSLNARSDSSSIRSHLSLPVTRIEFAVGCGAAVFIRSAEAHSTGDSAIQSVVSVVFGYGQTSNLQVKWRPNA